MPVWTGIIYTSATLTANGNSGWLNLAEICDLINRKVNGGAGVVSGSLSLIPADLATDETLDLDLDVGFTAAGLGAVKHTDFTQVDSNNTPELVELIAGTCLPQFIRLAWTLAGTTKSMGFILYGCLEFR